MVKLLWIRGKFMYVHLGKNCVIRVKDTVGIFDIENTSVSKITREFLNKYGKESKVFYVDDDLPKSFIIVKSNNENMIYISSLAPSTLKKRMENIRYEDSLFS